MESSITIERAVVADAESIFRLNRDEMGYDYDIVKTQDRLRTLIDHPEHRIFVARSGPHVVGYVHANCYDRIYSDSFKNILGIAVDRTYKRRGVGRKLLEEIERWAKEDNSSGVRLVSGSGRTDAHTFYIACGYAKNREQLNFTKTFIETNK